MHWFLCCLCVSVCVCVFYWACDLVRTSRLNLLKLYVYPALGPPAPPQALSVPHALCFSSSCLLQLLVKLLSFYLADLTSFLFCVCAGLSDKAAWSRWEGHQERWRRLKPSPPALTSKNDQMSLSQRCVSFWCSPSQCSGYLRDFHLKKMGANWPKSGVSNLYNPKTHFCNRF